MTTTTIAQLMAERGLTQQQLAVKSGLTQATICRIINRMVFPRPSHIRRIAAALGDDIKPEQIAGDLIKIESIN